MTQSIDEIREELREEIKETLSKLVLEIGGQVTENYQLVGGIWEGMSFKNVKTINRYVSLINDILSSNRNFSYHEGEISLARKVVAISRFGNPMQPKGLTMKKRLDLITKKMNEIIPDYDLITHLKEGK